MSDQETGRYYFAHGNDNEEGYNSHVYCCNISNNLRRYDMQINEHGTRDDSYDERKQLNVASANKCCVSDDD